VAGAIFAAKPAVKTPVHERFDGGHLEQTSGLLVHDENCALRHGRRVVNFVYHWQISFPVPLALDVRVKLPPVS